MTTTTMSAAELAAWTENQTGGKCNDCGTRCERTAFRCQACHLAMRKAASNARRKGDGIQNTANTLSLRGHVDLFVDANKKVGGHAHRFVLPFSPDEHGVYTGICQCGETKDHYPWGWNVLPGDGRKKRTLWATKETL